MVDPADSPCTRRCGCGLGSWGLGQWGYVGRGRPCCGGVCARLRGYGVDTRRILPTLAGVVTPFTAIPAGIVLITVALTLRVVGTSLGVTLTAGIQQADQVDLQVPLTQPWLDLCGRALGSFTQAQNKQSLWYMSYCGLHTYESWEKLYMYMTVQLNTCSW